MSETQNPPGLAGALDRMIAGWMADDSAPNRRACTSILVSAVVVGVLGNALFNGAGLGLNFPLWVGALLVAYVTTVTLAGGRLDGGRVTLLCLGLVCAAMVAWRGATTMQVLSIAAACGCLSLAAAMRPADGFRRLGLLEFWLAVAGIAVSVMAGLPRIVAVLRPSAWWGERSRQNALVLGRALVLTTPLLLGFGGLFVAADAVFESRVNAIFELDTAALRAHVYWTVGCAWAAAGVLWAGVAVRAPAGVSLEIPESKRLQTVEVIVVVGSLVVLFAGFVAIQVRYLFSGEGPVEASLNLTYAQYARRGFFELVAAASLLLPVLLAIDWALARRRGTRMAFRAMAGVLLVLLSVVMLSAFERMQVYKDAYGLTELRIYVTAILLWLGVIFAWFAATVLAGRRNQFAAVAVVTAVLAIVVLGLLGPDAMIARTNTARAAEGRAFDAEHAASLGPEAVPALIDGLDGLSRADACIVADGLLDRWLGESQDVRGWNYARAAAIDAVEDNEGRLLAACRP